jgi:hypothetical protein
MLTRLAALAVGVVTMVTLVIPATIAGENADDPWAPIRFLLGSWQGEATGFGGPSTVEHTYEMVLGNQFIQLRTRSISAARDGQPGDVHEDQGFFSYDRARERIVLRQFLSEGFVNTYVLDDIEQDGRVLVLTSESTENAGGMRARLRYTIESDDVYELVLELAQPGKDFAGCQSMRMRRGR